MAGLKQCFGVHNRIFLPLTNSERSKVGDRVLSTHKKSAQILPIFKKTGSLVFASRPLGRVARHLGVTCASGDGEEKSLAPLKPESPAGEFLNYILSSEPQLFSSAVDEQLSRLSDEAEQAVAPEGSTDIILFKRIQEVKRFQRQRALEDLMYASILHKFVSLGVDLLPALDGELDVGSASYKTLTEGVHSLEALDMVKQHLNTILGGAPPAFSNVMVKLSKLQAAQVYAASVMFGYFLRRVDRRFQLEKAVGTLKRHTQEDDLKTLEAMFSSAESGAINPDYPPVGEEGSKASLPTLKEYVASFNQATLSETAHIVSLEGVTLVERHTGALFGSIDKLQQEMQEVVGVVETPQEMMEKIQKAVESDTVKTLTLAYGTQRRIILEAVAFGSFLRDIESDVSTEYQLLTPSPPPPQLPPRQLS
eukprot:CAMPEP_0196574708 /NCGR_PEP_ID=MMETSP1081-20130531/4361_1 /TAXON_ID=36882 /ORGANISM="Pyramimonas amylifera, Strain CCMP720" /LENGTH=421 /DNA_ID=CAMNT_0041892805 /DNA_START=128 /DNA_END=1393 /DNA_ORIENTATION=-